MLPHALLHARSLAVRGTKGVRVYSSTVSGSDYTGLWRLDAEYPDMLVGRTGGASTDDAGTISVRCIGRFLARALLVTAAGCRASQPSVSDLEGSWRLERFRGGASSGVLDLATDGSCRADTAFLVFLSSCNATKVPPTSPGPCHWGVEPNEVQLVVPVDAARLDPGFLGLRLAAWRPFPGARVSSLQGSCTDGSEYVLSR
jgi:hypothetical protein